MLDLDLAHHGLVVILGHDAYLDAAGLGARSVGCQVDVVCVAITSHEGEGRNHDNVIQLLGDDRDLGGHAGL